MIVNLNAARQRLAVQGQAITAAARAVNSMDPTTIRVANAKLWEAGLLTASALERLAGGTVAVATAPKASVLDEVSAERDRQDTKWGQQNHPNGTGAGLIADLGAEMEAGSRHAMTEGPPTWAAILGEEVGEALQEGDCAKLRAELIQVAAVAVAWVEAIDRAYPHDRLSFESAQRIERAMPLVDHIKPDTRVHMPLGTARIAIGSALPDQDARCEDCRELLTPTGGCGCSAGVPRV